MTSQLLDRYIDYSIESAYLFWLEILALAIKQLSVNLQPPVLDDLRNKLFPKIIYSELWLDELDQNL